MHLLTKESMTQEDVNRMKLVFEAARKNINKSYDDVKQLVFKFDQYMIAQNFDEAEKLMGQIASLSVAITSWNLVKDKLDMFDDPYEALVEGTAQAFEFHMNALNKEQG